MKKSIAFFDFDGTITTKDTLLEFIKYSKGVLPFYIGFILNSPYLVAYKLKLIPNQRAKEKVLQYFFSKMPLDQFQELCDKFSENEIPKLLRPAAIEEIKRLREQQAEIVVVSASPANWIRKWATGMGLDLIATELQVSGGCLTGFIVGKNCHGQEKVSRITKTFNLPEFSEIYAYGDSSGDKPMLSLASSAHYKPFRG